MANSFLEGIWSEERPDALAYEVFFFINNQGPYLHSIMEGHQSRIGDSLLKAMQYQSIFVSSSYQEALDVWAMYKLAVL